jgi:hypothetical protein
MIYAPFDPFPKSLKHREVENSRTQWRQIETENVFYVLTAKNSYLLQGELRVEMVAKFEFLAQDRWVLKFAWKVFDCAFEGAIFDGVPEEAREWMIRDGLLNALAGLIG